MKFSIWGANLSGGFLRANVEQNTDGSMEYNRKLAKMADQLQVDSILYAIRYVGSIGGSSADRGQLDPLSVITALAGDTETFISLPRFYRVSFILQPSLK